MMLSCTSAPTTPPFPNLPSAPPAKADSVVDTIHGVAVADPYRWLENGADPAVQAWVAAQNERTKSAFKAVEGREEIRARLEKLVSIGRVASAQTCGKRIFHLRRGGKQNHYALYVRDSWDAPPRVAIDPNTFSTDGTVAMDWWIPSRDGGLVAYGVSAGGSELSTLKIRDITTGKDLADEIPNCRASSVAWRRDASGFYYTRYLEGDKYNRRVYYHTIGEDWKGDRLSFGEGRAKEDWPNVQLSPDDEWVVVTVYQGWSKSEMYIKRRTATTWIPVIEGRNVRTSGGVTAGRLWLMTNDGAPKNRILWADPEKPTEWKQVVAEGEGTIESFDLVKDRLIVRDLVNANARLRVLKLDGTDLGTIPLPTVGAIGGGMGEADGEDFVFDFQSFFVPPALYRYHVPTGKVTAFETLDAGIDLSTFEAKQVWYPSKDGTKISMFVAHKKGLVLDGSSPTLLTGYGGFNIPMTPGFGSMLFMWLESGGVYAMPNLRGGGEYGEDWHQAGMLAKKQNVFDDFIAAAEWLIRERYTTSSRLAISGGSNGGLLIGAVVTQRPELYRAAICAVPLLDMVRYHKFLIARLWIPEYGDPDKADDFKWIHAYSPYHRVKDGATYPAVFFTTAESDTRVDPCHARKMAARMQAATGSGLPIFLHIEQKAGHGAGKPIAKIIEDIVDQLSFLREMLP